jgi:Domain of Unknown Function (DUF1080)/Bacterial Ig domain
VFASKKGILIVAIISSFFLSTSSTTTFYSQSNSVFASADAIRPSITIIKPTDNSSSSIGVVEVEGTAIDNTYGSGVKTVEVKVDNGEYMTANPVSGIWSYWSITLDMQSSGSKRIVARVTDNAGNQNWDEITAIISGNTDLTRPSVKISQPAANAIVSEDKVVVAGRASDDLSGVKKVQVRVNDGPYTDAIPSSPGDWSSWSITLDFTSKAAADYEIIAHASDSAGNQNWDDVHITRPFYDDFSGARYRLAPGDISPNGKWYGLWDGGGAFGVKQDQKDASNNIFYEETAAVTANSQTESALVLTTQEFKDFKLSVDVRTDKHTRQNSLPNPWEVGWIIWKWNDNTNFYYFLVKTNGAEVGKYEGGVNPIDQKILKTSPSFEGSIGQLMHWDIIVKGNHITVIVDGITVFDFDDVSSFDAGTIGLYVEDAEVSFDNVVIIPL